MDFFKAVKERQEKLGTHLCLGLDPRTEDLDSVNNNPSKEDYIDWAERLLKETSEYICCVKPNMAFYQAGGLIGMETLAETIELAHSMDIPVLLDAKLGDIGSTAKAYAKAVFEWLKADAVTLNAYLGKDSVEPFLEYEGKGIFALCRTSNPSGEQLQNLDIGGKPLFRTVAEIAKEWGDRAGLVVGANVPEAVAVVRTVSDAWLLLPGIGAQGGDIHQTASAAGKNFICPVSRAIANADNPKQTAEKICDEIEKAASSPIKTLSGNREKLIQELGHIKAVKFGDFTLASGKKSPIYVDLRLLASDMNVLTKAADEYTSLLSPLDFEHIGAIPYAGMPIGTAVALKTGKPLVYPRKEIKDHGRGNLVEGAFKEGDRVVIVEDVITSGGSIIEGVEKLRSAGLVVTDAIALLDREAGGKDNLAKAGITLHSAFKLEEIINVLADKGDISEKQKQEVLSYIEANRK